MIVKNVPEKIKKKICEDQGDRDGHHLKRKAGYEND
jgi:hypothetical protein